MSATIERSLYDARRLGITMRNRRERLELTQEQVAAKSGISNKKISRMERGEINDPGFGDVLAVSRVLGWTPDQVATMCGLA